MQVADSGYAEIGTRLVSPCETKLDSIAEVWMPVTEELALCESTISGTFSPFLVLKFAVENATAHNQDTQCESSDIDTVAENEVWTGSG